MKKQTIKQGLVGLLTVGALTLGSTGISGCSEYISNKNFKENLQKYSNEITEEDREGLINEYKSIKPKENSEILKELYSQSDKSKKEFRKEAGKEFNEDFGKNLFDTNNVSEKDLIFIQRYMKAKYEGVGL